MKGFCVFDVSEVCQSFVCYSFRMERKAIIETEWGLVLATYVASSAYKNLITFVEQEYATKNVLPSQDDIYKAFTLTPFSQVKVVIVGQDPYHNEDQAEGLCFSVQEGVALPPSLKNMYKEIESDCSISKDKTSGSLQSWAKQGVFLMNSILTVIAHEPASHKGKGWEEFTDTVIKTISDKHKHIVFMLWGNYAKSKKYLIDTDKHYVLEAAHPSPFSAHSGFFGCKHFSKCNTYLKKNGKNPIDW